MVDGAPGAVPVWQQDQRDAAAAHRSRWRLLAVVAAAAAWIYPSLLAWFLIVIGLTGLGTDNGVTVGMLDGGAEGAASFASGLVIEMLGGAALVFVARWAIRQRRVASAVGVGATVWVQVIASWVALV